MYYLYILKFKIGKFYTGVTNNIERRIKEHKNKTRGWTKSQGDFILIYSEEFPTLSEAKKKEWKLKCTPWGGKLKRRLAGSFDRDGGGKTA